MNIYQAIVTEVLPSVAGVRVRFRDLVPSGFGMNDYVLVLNARMSDSGGASLWLPQVGEHGVVACLTGGVYVWLGSLPFLDKNQVDPTPDIAYFRHQSGTTVQIRDNGDMEILHPSGLRITASESGEPLPSLQRTSHVETHGGTIPAVVISHPGGAEVSIGVEGAMILKSPAITLDGPVICTQTLQVDGVLFVDGSFGTHNPSGMISGNLFMTGYGRFQDVTFTSSGFTFFHHRHTIPFVGISTGPEQF